MSDMVLPAVQTRAPGETGSDLEIRLFGSMEVRIGPAPLPRLRSRKGLWLLALLALRAGHDVERDWLAETLWPNSSQADARRSLRQSLHDLRLALGPMAHRLASEAPRTLRLDLPGASVDVLTFEAAIARDDLESLEAAVGLYRGPLLEDCAEEWILAERQPREQAYVAALERLAKAATARGDYAAAARHLQLAVRADPYREDLQRALMEALAAGGSPAGALLVYRQYRDLLWREMAAEPAEETAALFRRLRDATRARAKPRIPDPPLASPTPSMAAGPRNNLPEPWSTFVGRERELQEVGACLGSARLVTLTGTGGIGKTRLAIRVAEERACEFADGAWFVDLAALTDPALVPQAVARSLRVRETPGSPLTETLQEALGARELLMVLDNCEHLIDACARLTDMLLSSAPHLRILATSRQALGLIGETVWPVPPLSLPVPRAGSMVEGQGSNADRVPPRPSTLDPQPSTLNPQPSALLASEAVHLFVARATAAEPGFALTERNAGVVARVCRRLDGIPLAIELAAARLKVFSIEQIAARLDDRFHLLTGGSRAALPRQQTLRAMMDWSFDLLAEPERILLRRLSVFTGGFTLEAAEAVCSDFGFRISDFGFRTAEPDKMDRMDRIGPTDLPHPDHSVLSVEVPESEIRNPKSEIRNQDVLDLLTSLVDRSLVGVERREGAARYVLLETTRDYARDRLREAGEEEERRARHARCFLTLAERGELELKGAAQAEWLQRLEEEHDNLRAAIDHFLARGAVEEGLQLGGALGWFWWLRGYLSEGRERLEALLRQPLPHAGVRRAQAKALNAAGMLADDQSEYDVARALFQESLAISRELGDQPGAAVALNNLGGQAVQARDFPAARALYEESLAIWQAVHDPWWTAAALTNLGRVALLEGQETTARALIKSALEIQRPLGDRHVIARSLLLLGSSAARLGDYEEARLLHEESLTIVRELGAKVPIEETLRALGSMARERGDHEAASAYHEERLTIAREMGNAWGTAESLYYLGLLAYDRGDGSRARQLWSESLSISQRLGDHPRIAECLEAFASLAARPGFGEPGPSAPGSRASGEADDVPDAAQSAARLLGAAAALRERAGTPVISRRRAEYERQVAAARAGMDAATFDAAWAEGRAMPPEEAIRVALGGAGDRPLLQ